jgi:hypothetical protein
MGGVNENLSTYTELQGRVVRNPVADLGSPGFRSRPVHRLFWTPSVLLANTRIGP